jgi:hypothetical protein
MIRPLTESFAIKTYFVKSSAELGGREMNTLFTQFTYTNEK